VKQESFSGSWRRIRPTHPPAGVPTSGAAKCSGHPLPPEKLGKAGQSGQAGRALPQ